MINLFEGLRPAPVKALRSLPRHHRKAFVISLAELQRCIDASDFSPTLRGNDYRLVVAVDFEKGIVWIKWIGTDKAYDKIDVTEVRYGD